MLTYKNLYSVSKSAASLVKEVERDTTTSVLPLAHSFGLSTTNSILLLGNSLVVLRKFDLKEIFEAIEKYHVSHISLVPAMIQKWYPVKKRKNSI